MKWNGEKFEEALNNDLDKLLTSTEKQELLEQIDADADFKSSANLYYLMHELLAEVGSIDDNSAIPAGFTEGVMNRLSSVPTYAKVDQSFFTNNYIKYFAGLAACIALFAISMWNSNTQLIEELDRTRPNMVANDHSQPINGSAIYTYGDEQSLSIISAVGQVQVFKQDGFVWQNIGGSTNISLRDKVRTLAGGSVHLAYPDGVEIKLKPNSLIALESDGLRVFQGDSWVHVSRKGRKFETRTPNLVASVRGTIYDVSVRYSQQSYSAFVKSVTRKNVLKGTDPALYFRDVSLDTLNEMGNRQFAGAVETSVRVFESSVDVKPISPETGQSSLGVILPQGKQIKLVSVRPILEDSQIHDLAKEDYHYWNMEAPAKPKVDKGAADFSSNNLPRDASSSNDSSTSDSEAHSDELSPSEAMNTIHD